MRATSPLRQLALTGALAAAGLLVLLAHAATVTAGPGGAAPTLAPRPVRADTDTVVVRFPDGTFGTLLVTDPAALDSLLAADSLVVVGGAPGADGDSLVAGDTVRVPADSLARLYFPERAPDAPAAALVPRTAEPFGLAPGAYWRQEVALDSAALEYRARETVGEEDVRVPIGVDLETYRAARLRQALEGGFREIAAQRARAARPGRAGFGVTIDIPGGNQSPFRTLFGRNEVDLRVNGQANIDAGMNYQTNELQQAVSGRSGALNPDFGQELRLGITGTIGDKLRVNVNYDTQNQFDFENQVSLVYTGYDDDIIQRIEAGNVFLQSPSELIRGGQRLFGIRTDLRLGPFAVTAVASQQDAQSSELSIEGGSQATSYSLAPYDYEDNTHFYLGYRFYSWWDAAHASPTTLSSPPGFDQVVNIEVWRFDPSPITGNSGETEVRTQALALADLAEPGPNPPPPNGTPFPGAPPRGVLAGGRAYLDALGAQNAPLPDSSLDQYSEPDLERFRDSTFAVDFGRFGLRQGDYAQGQFRLLRPGVDYDYDRRLGTISLARALTESERLGVAYQYRREDGTQAGQIVQVGDYGQASQGSSNGRRIVLKLLRADNPTPTSSTWDLTMRNVYRIGGRQLTAAEFDLDVYFEPNGTTPQKTLPGVVIGEQAALLQVLGLDRLNRDGAAQPDDAFDFVGGITVDAEDGRVIFPYREPFGRRLRTVLRGEADEFDVQFQTTTLDAALNDFAFDTLYALKPDQARLRFPDLANYQIAGSYRSSVQSTFDLGFGIVANSVRVTANGVPLTLGADYTVNEATGQLEVVNRAYLSPGQSLRIEYERNQFASIGSKTLLGLRAEYALNERVGVGATWMRLAERPLVDKYRIGEEPIQNAVLGLDARYEASPRWITRLVDALPLINTRAESRFEFKGEFARLTPGHPETFAFDRARGLLRESADGRDFSPDEIGGVSYIDDFEGSENTLSLTSPGEWTTAAAPHYAPDEGAAGGSGPGIEDLPWRTGLAVTDPRIVTNWRGRVGWYTLLNSIYTGPLCESVACTTPAVAQVSVEQLLGRQRRRGEADELPTFDFYFDPTRRGPYNVNQELETTFAATPTAAWGGITQRLREGYTDFTARNNIEFIEFLFAPLGGRDGDEPVQPGAVLYVDLGSVSEDVIPNNRVSGEDGLIEQPATAGNSDAWGRFPTGQALNTLDVDEATNRTEDLGLDGLPSRRENPAGTAYEASERDPEFFGPFVDALTPGTAVRALAERDPAGDDFHNYQEAAFFEDPSLFPAGARVQERFSWFFGSPEFNGFESQRDLARSGHEGASRFPDTEDLDGSTSPNLTESHHRYAIPLDAAGLRTSPYFQNEIVLPDGRVWYLMRVPVRAADRTEVGGIEDFTRIESVRLWTTGHDRPATLRFASLELVGSQWLKSERVGIEEDTAAVRTTPRVFLATINNEESPNQYAVPLGAIVSATRDFSGALYDNREQSLVLRVEDFADGVARAIYRPFSTARLDLTRYTNLRMFVHGEGFERRDNVRVFMRLGANETTDYYELEQPLYPYEVDPTSTARPNPDSLWQTNVRLPDGRTMDLNSINIPLEALNRLKAARDADPTAPRDAPWTAPPGFVVEGLPPGAVLRIRGNPSIRSVSTVVAGVVNGAGGTPTALENVEVWFNELRVTGYEEAGGWSAYARTVLRLADVADVNARFSQTTDGFGELSGGLGTRSFTERQEFSVLGTVNLHRLVPERLGIAAPLAFSVQQNLTAPRFDPRRGDIRVEELVRQAETDPTLAGPARDSLAAAVRLESQTYSAARSLRLQLSKTGSRSPWLRYTLDGLSLVYTAAAERSRSPSQVYNNRDSWSGAFSYRLAVPRARTVRPFWFVEDVPVLGVLGGLRFNYLPQSLRFAANANRSITRDQERLSLAARSDSVLRTIPLRFLTPQRGLHLFGHDRNIDVQYNPFTFLALGYRSNVFQSLASAGADFTTTVFVRDSAGQTQTFEGLTRAAVFAPGGPGRLFLGIPDSVSTVTNAVLQEYGALAYPTTALSVRPLGQVLGDVLAGRASAITDRYDQGFTATFQPTLDRVRWLAWLRLQPVSFTSQFNWNFVPLQADPDAPGGPEAPPEVGAAGVGTNMQLRSGLSLRPREFWRLFPFYRRMEEASRAGGPAAAGRGGERQGAGARTPAPAGRAATPTDSTAAPPAPRRPPFNPLSLVRRLFLAVTGVEDVTMTYSGTQTSASSGLRAGGYSLLDALTGSGPSLGYRLGLDRRIPATDEFRLVAQQLQLQDNLTGNHRLDARTTLRLSSQLNVNLSWLTNWNDGATYSFTPNDAGGFDERAPSRNGGSEGTVIGIGGGYARLLEAQQARLQADLADPDVVNGRVRSGVLAVDAVAEDFRRSFVRTMGLFGPDALFAVPLPNWDVTYTGLARWPLFRVLTQQVQLRHGYSATYRVGYQSNALAGQNVNVDLRPPGQEQIGLFYEQPDLTPNTLTLNERFQPLLGLNVTWRGGIQTEATWNKTNSAALTTTAGSVAETRAEELSLRVSWAKTGLRLPFLRSRRLNNNLRFTLTLARTTSTDQALLLRQDLEDTLAGNPLQRQERGQIRLSAEPRLSYTLSNQVSVDFFLRYASVEGRNSQIPTTSQLDGGVSFRVSFSN